MSLSEDKGSLRLSKRDVTFKEPFRFTLKIYREHESSDGSSGNSTPFTFAFVQCKCTLKGSFTLRDFECESDVVPMFYDVQNNIEYVTSQSLNVDEPLGLR